MKILITFILIFFPVYLFAADIDVDSDNNSKVDGAAEVYSSGWDSDVDAPQKNDIYDYFTALVVKQSDCSTITAGMCLDTDDGKLYSWDGDSVELVGVLDFEATVTEGSLTDSVIVSADIKDGEIVSADIKDDEIVSEDIKDGEIATADMGANSVDSDAYVDASVDNAHVATGLDAVKLGDGSFDNTELQQVGTIGATTISIGQWVFVGEADQATNTDDAVGFLSSTATHIDVCHTSEPTALLVVGRKYCAKDPWDPTGTGTIIDHWVRYIDDDPVAWELVDDTAGNVYFQSLEISSIEKPNVAYSTSQTLSVAEMSGHQIYATGALTYTLQEVFSGAGFKVVVIGAHSVSIDPNIADRIWLNGTALDDGDKITSDGSTGQMAECTYYSATGFFCDATGWTDGG